MSSKEPVDLTGRELESAKDENSVMVVDFWAEWCGACKMMEPIMDSLAEEYGDRVFFGKLNVGDDRKTALEYQISSIPALIFFKNGELADKVVGAVSEERLEKKVKELIE
ncbi:hypothetical protein AKJ57_04840 [candidate division MSBL1 archaeon SCGC-AAA259A05]|uniref:Thioredoxin domain-containing protein n=1 Tax=candidate division MSBL1 archaeon SCGC-AAA259A05 TaxID=1698259 RepID=A0A133U6I4_9EURY|nr:hypothetical protein AKJ57_04840 [candidate division MSBL1 archaeon SCGC-AAA259A05]